MTIRTEWRVVEEVTDSVGDWTPHIYLGVAPWGTPLSDLQQGAKADAL